MSSDLEIRMLELQVGPLIETVAKISKIVEFHNSTLQILIEQTELLKAENKLLRNELNDLKEEKK